MSETGHYWFMVFSNPVAGHQAEYEEWYDNVHFPDLLAIPGFVSGQRFRLTDAQARPGEHPHQFLVVWELAADNLAGVFDEIHRRRADGRVRPSPAYDRSTSQTHTYEPVAARVPAQASQSGAPPSAAAAAPHGEEGDAR